MLSCHESSMVPSQTGGVWSQSLAHLPNLPLLYDKVCHVQGRCVLVGRFCQDKGCTGPAYTSKVVQAAGGVQHFHTGSNVHLQGFMGESYNRAVDNSRRTLQAVDSSFDFRHSPELYTLPGFFT